jgi:hypothetical protein
MSDLKLVQILGNPFSLNINLVPMGAYNAATTYVIGNSVSYNGSSYVCSNVTTGNLPTNTTYWQLLAQGSTASSVSYQYQVTAGDISANQLTLTSTPTIPTNVKVDVVGGCAQANGVDFTVSGNILSWASLGMATAISVNDYLIISY